MAQLKAGMRLRSAVSEVELIVIKAESASAMTCGGTPMLAGSEPAAVAAIPTTDDGQCQLGKRYVNESGTVEVVCVKAGKGTLAVDGDPVQVKAAKALPSSD